MKLLGPLSYASICILVGVAGHPVGHCIHDLSYPYDEKTINWIGNQPFNFTRKVATTSENGGFYAFNEFQTTEHGGTHMDAPYHFNINGWKIGDIPTDRFFANGVYIHAEDEAAANPNYALTVDKLVDWEKRNGLIPEKSVIIANFGWAHKYPDWQLYYGSQTLTEDNLHFPGFSKEAADWIIMRKNKIFGIGLDTPSGDPGEKTNYPVHYSILGENMFILENINLKELLLPDKFQLTMLPMKIREGTGAPVRIFAKTC